MDYKPIIPSCMSITIIPPLLFFLKLYNKGVNACGTARTSRKFYPKTLSYIKTQVGEGFYDYRSSGPLLAAVWLDKRIINFLTTMHVAESSDPVYVRRKSMTGTREDVECPPCLPDYQAYMRGVDRADQLIHYYNIGRRSIKWWKRVFTYIVEAAALNAFVLFEHAHTNSRKDYLTFRLALAEELVGPFCSRSQPGRRRSSQQGRLDGRSHLPEYVNIKRDCVVCMEVRKRQRLSRKEFRHESKIKCQSCDVFLCVAKDRNCFLKYHTLTNYWT